MLTNATKQRLLSATLTYYGASVAVEPIEEGLRFSCTRPIVGHTEVTVATLDGVLYYSHARNAVGYRNGEANKIFALWCMRAVSLACDLSTVAAN